MQTLSPQILANHASLSVASKTFVEFAVGSPEKIDTPNPKDSNLPDFLRKFEYSLNPWPCFISKQTRQTFSTYAAALPKLVSRVLALEFPDKAGELAAFYGIPEAYARIIVDGNVDMRLIPMRLDLISTASGFKLLEMNPGSTVGGWESRWLDQLYRKQNTLAGFLEKHSCQLTDVPSVYFRYLVNVLVAQKKDAANEYNVAILLNDNAADYDAETILNDIYTSVLRQQSLQGRIYCLTDYKPLDFDGNGVSISGKNISAFITARSDTTDNPPLQLLRAFLSRQLFWPENPLFYFIYDDKRTLALLYKNRNNPGLSDEDSSTIKEMIPWCTDFTQESIVYENQTWGLRGFLNEYKEKLVLKMARSKGGQGVFIGKTQGIDEWSKLVDRAFMEKSWLVQEFCQTQALYFGGSDSEINICDSIWGVFSYGGSYGGCWLRLMAQNSGDGIINSEKGAEETLVYEVAK